MPAEEFETRLASFLQISIEGAWGKASNYRWGSIRYRPTSVFFLWFLISDYCMRPNSRSAKQNLFDAPLFPVLETSQMEWLFLYLTCRDAPPPRIVVEGYRQAEPRRGSGQG